MLLIDGELRDIKEQNLEKELKKLELDGKKPIKLSDAEHSKLSKLEGTEIKKVSMNADGDKSKIEFNSVERTDKDGSIIKDKTLVGKGEQYTNGRKNKLNPNIRYKTGEYDYFYETDNLGRLSKFETDYLQLTKRKERLPHSKNTPGKIKGKDDAGHLAGDRFGGSPKIDNLVSQLSDVNQKQFKKIENMWAAALNAKPPKKVTVDIEMIYSEEGVRPDKFIVKYTIDGKPGINVFENN
ncbi:DNA/RNA non-specific endonuclease [Paenibacillus sp. sgz5001063]|uniref:DNA/RNA non-specific endonuclease n=1 Tax=Paenibacillus sp. sgz5001063 TaxID=3242474 RepID=UPI0036D2CD9D